MATDAPSPRSGPESPARLHGWIQTGAVASGIFLSRIAGLVRERVFAHFFGTSPFADVFRAALRLPNVLQNLLGEGTLSASFIPVYSELREQRRDEEAGRVAGTLFALLVAVLSILGLLGIYGAPLLVRLFLPGFEGLRRDLAISCTRIIFPMTGVLVLSAWCLGILNSHRRFFLPYVAPVLWNGAMIATLLLLGGELSSERLVVALAWGALAGAVLQFLVQLPQVLRLERELRVCWFPGNREVREVVRNALPAILGRGVVQLGSWLDLVLASFLQAGAVAVLGYAQTLYLLPVSLFGMSVAAAELPELSRRRGESPMLLRKRVEAALARMAALVVPSAVAYLLLGEVVVGALYQTGDFTAADTRLVAIVLAGYTLGLVASTQARLLSSSFFALRDTVTPARWAGVRVILSAGLSLVLMFRLDRLQIGDRPLGALGLALAAGIAAWVEWGLLVRSLRSRIGGFDLAGSTLLRAGLAALGAAILGRLAATSLASGKPLAEAILVLPLYGAAYFALAHLLGVQEVGSVVRKILSRFRRHRGCPDEPEKR